MVIPLMFTVPDVTVPESIFTVSPEAGAREDGEPFTSQFEAEPHVESEPSQVSVSAKSRTGLRHPAAKADAINCFRILREIRFMENLFLLPNSTT